MYFTIPILLNNNLTFPDGTKFYPDIQNGERGYNTDPARGADTFCPFIRKLTIRGTMYAEARVYNGSSYTWTNFATKSVVFSVENGQTNIVIESGNGNTSARSIDFIRSRLVINSVSID